MALKCSIARERKHFIHKLASNPFFLLQHTPALLSVVLKRYRQRRNRKVFPPWLPKQLKKLSSDESKAIWQRIPYREECSEAYETLKIFNGDNSTSDQEDYFAQHRFTELLQFHNAKGQHNLPPRILKWLNEPPPKNDLAWETYSTSERVANLLTWISFIQPEARHHLPQNIALFLTDSLEWIYHHLEYYRRNTNNHIINNARALVMCGVALNHQQAILSGLEIFRRFLPILIQRNGTLRERSTHYQLIILNWLLDAYSFLSHANIITTYNLEETIMRVRDMAALFSDDKGYLQAYIGDISPDLSPKLTVKRLRNCYPLFWPRKKDNEKIWQKDETRTITQYDDYYFLNKNQHKIILNYPKDRFPQRHPTHAHNDLTSFVWWYGDQAILIDSGRTRYNKDPISSQQKSAIGHNLPLVNQFPPCCESLVIQGNWWPMPYALAHFSIHSNPHHRDSLQMKHNGFKRATPVKQHTRTIFIDHNNQLQIEDLFQGKEKSKKTVTIQLLWHFHPAFSPLDHGLMNDNIMVTFLTDAEHIEILQDGFSSSQYGEVLSHPILLLQWQVQLPFIAKTTFKVKERCVA